MDCYLNKIIYKNFKFQRYNVCLIGIGSFRKEYKSSLLLDSSTKSAIASVEDHHLHGGSSSYNSATHNIDLTCMSKRTIQLNPGSQYQIEAQDLCFYISLVKEENYEFKTSKTLRLCVCKEIINPIFQQA